MNLESQVCSLDLAKKLKALGVEQESAFFWLERAWLKEDGKAEYEWIVQFTKDHEFEICESISAFNSGELGVALPPYFHTHRLKDGKWKGLTDEDIADTEANARAKMLCYLIENKIITVEEVNERLRRAG